MRRGREIDILRRLGAVYDTHGACDVSEACRLRCFSFDEKGGQTIRVMVIVKASKASSAGFNASKA